MPSLPPGVKQGLTVVGAGERVLIGLVKDGREVGNADFSPAQVANMATIMLKTVHDVTHRNDNRGKPPADLPFKSPPVPVSDFGIARGSIAETVTLTLCLGSERVSFAVPVELAGRLGQQLFASGATSSGPRA